MSWVMRKRIHQIELFIKFPHDVQNEILFKLLDTAKIQNGEKSMALIILKHMRILKIIFLFLITMTYQTILKD